MKSIVAVRDNLAFTCRHEADQLPSLNSEANSIFLFGRYLQNRSAQPNYDEIARYYRISSAYGNYKANRNLQLLVSQGLATSPVPQDETIALAQALIKQGIPGGYYDMAHYLEIGYGVKQDKEAALKYFRRAADLGNPEAQAYIGDLLEPVDNAPAVARELRRCAAAQGYGKAAMVLGVDLHTDKIYAEAVGAYQEGVKAGNSLSAGLLQEGFAGPPSTDRLYYLGLKQDDERVRRYKLIGAFLDRNESKNPTVPDIDKIVPLPPATLPHWDGTFQWQKERDAAVPPEKPSEALIERMSKAKGLNPATGLPLADSKTS